MDFPLDKNPQNDSEIKNGFAAKVVTKIKIYFARVTPVTPWEEGCAQTNKMLKEKIATARITGDDENNMH